VYVAYDISEVAVALSPFKMFCISALFSLKSHL